MDHSSALGPTPHFRQCWVLGSAVDRGEGDPLQAVAAGVWAGEYYPRKGVRGIRTQRMVCRSMLRAGISSDSLPAPNLSSALKAERSLCAGHAPKLGLELSGAGSLSKPHGEVSEHAGTLECWGKDDGVVWDSSSLGLAQDFTLCLYNSNPEHFM